MKKNLTDRFVRFVKPTAKEVDYWDETLTGFGLRVSPKGKKSFQIYYRHHRLQRRMSIGPFPVLSVAAARKIAREQLADAARGLDPASRRKVNRNAETFAQLAKDYISFYAKRRKRSWREDERIINRDLLPSWKSRKAKDITRRDIQEVILKIVDRAAPIMANRTLIVIRQILNFGVDNGRLEFNPCHRIPRPGVEQRRRRFLDDDELAKVAQTLNAETSGEAAILMLQLLTGQRVGEVRRMQVADLDLSRGWWTIPSEFSKNGRSHRVPISPAVQAILAPRAEKAKGRWIFPSHRDKTRPVGYPTIHYAVRRISKAAGVTDWRSHDLRRTVATHLTGTGLPRLVLKQILNHRDTEVTAAYDAYEHDNQKKVALDDWGRRLTAIINGIDETAKVVVFASRKK